MSAQPNRSYVGLRPEIYSRVPTEALRILDVGASDGTLGAFLLEQNPARAVYGVEADRNLARTAAERLTGVAQVDAEALDWASIGGRGSFDCIIFADVLEHLSDPWTVLAKASRRLSPAGTVVISLPNIRHVSAAWSIFVGGSFPRRSRGVFDETHLRWFTLRDAKGLCADAGLRVADADYNFRWFDRVGGVTNNVVGAQRWLRYVPVVRDFLGYQMVVVAEPESSMSGGG
ncbi:MAG: methyltransferase domain-containing protein [Myxococcota bacterium]